MAENYVVTTKKAREKFVKAHGGDITLPTITQIGFGNGGHDAVGNPTNPSDEATVVSGEIIRKPISSNSYPISTILRIQGILDFSDANGEDISAIGLYDSDGDLVALKHTGPRPKTSDTRFEIEWDEIL